jgi:hypothetical protein
LARKERITISSFASDFDYFSEQEAHSAYVNLLSSSLVPQATRLHLKENYRIWQNNHAEKYWAERIASRQVDVMLTRTPGEIVLGSERFSNNPECAAK